MPLILPFIFNTCTGHMLKLVLLNLCSCVVCYPLYMLLLYKLRSQFSVIFPFLYISFIYLLSPVFYVYCLLLLCSCVVCYPLYMAFSSLHFCSSVSFCFLICYIFPILLVLTHFFLISNFKFISKAQRGATLIHRKYTRALLKGRNI
jgi:hypothetical protein